MKGSYEILPGLFGIFAELTLAPCWKGQIALQARQENRPAPGKRLLVRQTLAA
jgi:hypothetical protein